MKKTENYQIPKMELHLLSCHEQVLADSFMSSGENAEVSTEVYDDIAF